ncbi:MAG TPA: bifunctional DNA-formamidopyrimidine glycosylase/DNA-(apurinic or apyrimidinic site) lyase [Gemmatimonadales bacterium]|nr:bifunctional DNA-formamidopyrimidine glycosylase/DNA-(apurinic or apyrimidinic site) lyase [Gemmatimonadales bacterium]
MPELPEVETIVRDLAPRLDGFRIADARLKKTDVLRRVSKQRLLSVLKGNTFEAVTRRAKHAVFRLASGHRMVIQPRMTGALIVYAAPLSADDEKYAVLVCTLEDGRLFVYRDVRRLGTVWLLDERAWAQYTSKIGPEPLEDSFTPLVFTERLKGTRAAVKKAIMDQRRVAGVGNIYANEALFEAGIDPSRATNTLSLEEFARLHAAVRGVLERAVRASGTTVRDYRTGTGESGSFQFQLKVYGRGGESCVQCGRRLFTTHAIDLRATTVCPSCQR